MYSAISSPTRSLSTDRYRSTFAFLIGRSYAMTLTPALFASAIVSLSAISSIAITTMTSIFLSIKYFICSIWVSQSPFAFWTLTSIPSSRALATKTSLSFSHLSIRKESKLMPIVVTWSSSLSDAAGSSGLAHEVSSPIIMIRTKTIRTTVFIFDPSLFLLLNLIFPLLVFGGCYSDIFLKCSRKIIGVRISYRRTYLFHRKIGAS